MIPNDFRSAGNWDEGKNCSKLLSLHMFLCNICHCLLMQYLSSIEDVPGALPCHQQERRSLRWWKQLWICESWSKNNSPLPCSKSCPSWAPQSTWPWRMCRISWGWRLKTQIRPRAHLPKGSGGRSKSLCDALDVETNTASMCSNRLKSNHVCCKPGFIRIGTTPQKDTQDTSLRI